MSPPVAAFSGYFAPAVVVFLVLLGSSSAAPPPPGNEPVEVASTGEESKLSVNIEPTDLTSSTISVDLWDASAQAMVWADAPASVDGPFSRKEWATQYRAIGLKRKRAVYPDLTITRYLRMKATRAYYRARAHLRRAYRTLNP